MSGLVGLVRREISIALRHERPTVGGVAELKVVSQTLV